MSAKSWAASVVYSNVVAAIAFFHWAAWREAPPERVFMSPPFASGLVCAATAAAVAFVWADTNARGGGA